MKKVIFIFLLSCLSLTGFGTQTAHAVEKTMRLQKGFGKILRFDQDAGQILVSNPAIADVEVVTEQAIYIFGVANGETSIAVVDDDANTIAKVRVVVSQSASTERESVNNLGLGKNVKVTYLGDRPLISGDVQTPEQRKRLEALRLQLDGDTSAADITQYTGPTQILLQLRIAEIRTNGLRRSGINFDSGEDFILLDSLAKQGIAQILAEPSLMTTDGVAAQFSSGGEFSFDSENEGTGVGFRSFGIVLEFTPTIIDSHRLSIQLKGEVSSPTTSLNTGNTKSANLGRSIQSVNSTVELQSGATYTIAGLFQQRSSLSRNELPVISRIPVIGELFKSERFEGEETELLILVTPKIVPRNFVPSQQNADTVSNNSTIADSVGFTLRPGLLK